jgi:hypothetical protein
VIAWYCSSLLWLAESPYLSGIFFTGLHTIAENCALGDVEVMYIDVRGVRISSRTGALRTSEKWICLDRNSHGILSLGAYTASAMDEALG